MKDNMAITNILYCTDLGEHTAPVFRYALAQAINNHTSITILHVVEPLTETAETYIDTYHPNTDTKQLRQEKMQKVLGYMKKRIENFLTNECESDAEKNLIEKITVVVGRPSEEILNSIEKYDIGLVVMGKSSSRVQGNKVMGSTARRINRLSKVPVLIIPNRS